MAKKILALIFFTTVFIACGQKTDSKEILFVCTHGAARSPIAAAYFNKMAKEQDLNYHAVFRGTEPDKSLTSGTVAGLTNDNFEVSAWKPEKVSASDIEKAYKIVTFDCVLPSGKSKPGGEQWNGTPPISKDYDKVRNLIKEKVKHLVANLPRQ